MLSDPEDHCPSSALRKVPLEESQALAERPKASQAVRSHVPIDEPTRLPKGLPDAPSPAQSHRFDRWPDILVHRRTIAELRGVINDRERWVALSLPVERQVRQFARLRPGTAHRLAARRVRPPRRQNDRGDGHRNAKISPRFSIPGPLSDVRDTRLAQGEPAIAGIAYRSTSDASELRGVGEATAIRSGTSLRKNTAFRCQTQVLMPCRVEVFDETFVKSNSSFPVHLRAEVIYERLLVPAEADDVVSRYRVLVAGTAVGEVMARPIPRRAGRAFVVRSFWRWRTTKGTWEFVPRCSRRVATLMMLVAVQSEGGLRPS